MYLTTTQQQNVIHHLELSIDDLNNLGLTFEEYTAQYNDLQAQLDNALDAILICDLPLHLQGYIDLTPVITIF